MYATSQRVLGVALALGFLAQTPPFDSSLSADAPTLASFDRPFTAGEKEHWSFQPISKPEIPPTRNNDWVRTPIDAFLLAKMEESAIAPAPPADPATLLRRVYFDLIGLPPSPAELAAFLADPSPTAYAQVVDELLARPQYGERWARHWLDVVRYADSNGYERDNPKPHAWRYRDYVIKSLNADKPYDRFLVEQLAGDELEDADAETQIATTFLRLGPWDDEPADNVMDRYDQLDDVMGTTCRTFLAMTMQCARCHSHKFEPLTQVDYARMLAVFEPLKRPQEGRTDLDRLVGTATELASFREKMKEADSKIDERRKLIHETRERIRIALLAEKKTTISPEAIEAFQCSPEKRNDRQKKLVDEFGKTLDEEVTTASSQEDQAKMQGWEKEIKETDSSRPPEPPRAYVWYEENNQPPVTKVFVRGDPANAAMEVPPGLPMILASYHPQEPARPLPASTGRRLWLARWLTRPDHPLTARVMVNRIWQHHFGEGIVDTESDFGIMGSEPSHPELLDWLASNFMAEGWRLKPIHRLIVLSNAYQMSSTWNEAAAKEDVYEKLIWRWKPRRLEAEALRDSILSVSGTLNTSMFGPSVFPEISKSVLQTQSQPGNGWKPSDPRAAARRTIYIFVKRSLLVPELEVLDFPDTNGSCEQRNVSTIAPQALTLMNGKFMRDQATAFARRLAKEAGTDPSKQIELAFRLALSRDPKANEQQAVLAFLDDHAKQITADRQNTAAEKPAENESLKDPRSAALEAFCLVLLNTNEFAYVD